jgi:hypothetical protein
MKEGIWSSNSRRATVEGIFDGAGVAIVAVLSVLPERPGLTSSYFSPLSHVCPSHGGHLVAWPLHRLIATRGRNMRSMLPKVPLEGCKCSAHTSISKKLSGIKSDQAGQRC